MDRTEISGDSEWRDEKENMKDKGWDKDKRFTEVGDKRGNRRQAGDVSE